MTTPGAEDVDAYPVPQFEEHLESRVAPFRSGKDTVRFLHEQDLPYDLVADVCDQLAGPDR